MPKNFKKVARAGFAGGLSMFALLALGAGNACAQDAGDADEQMSSIDMLNADIIVTATKKKDVENVQAP